MQEITDPISFLQTLRQIYWFGQSYDEIYDQLSRLIMVKIYAERTGQVLTSDCAEILWGEAHEKHSLPADFGVFHPLKLQAATDYLANYRLSGNNYLWHVMHRAWLKHHTKRDHGQYYTPQFIKRFMISIYPPGPGMAICDPCGGSAGFVIEAADRLPDIDPSLFYYMDIDSGQTFKSAKMILSLYQHKSGKDLSTMNMLSTNSLAGQWPRRMDRIYTNVPFGVRVSRSDTMEDNVPILDLYRTGVGKASELSQVLFIERCLRYLTPRGCFATVADRGVVTNEKLRKDRAALLQSYGDRSLSLQLVVELPGVAFEYVAGTTFPTYLLFFSAVTDGRTYFGKVENVGYDDSGYVIGGQHVGGFPPHADNDAWDASDWPKVLAAYESRTLPSVPHKDVMGGDWHHGKHAYRSHTGKRLRDVAALVEEPWPGDNKRNPSVDRQFRVINDTHLNPMKKQRVLRLGCIFMSRIIPDSQEPCAGIVTGPYDGAGCTNENYIIRPNGMRDLVRIWYLINFDDRVHKFLRSNSRGQGRNRIMAKDLMSMPIYDVPKETLIKAEALLERLHLKVDNDIGLTKELVVIANINM